MSKIVTEYLDTGETIYGQMHTILVECPHCRSCACITPHPATEPHSVNYFTPRCLIVRQVSAGLAALKGSYMVALLD